MPCSPSKRSTRMARGMNPTMSGHHPPAKHQKPPVRLCPLCPADSPGPIYGLTPFSAFARWILDVRCWMFGVYHKLTKYNPPLPPPPGRSGDTLVPPWTYPGTIDHLPDPLFDQALLSKSVFSGVSALCRCSGLDVKGWMLGLGCSVFPTRRSSFAVCLRRPAPLKYA